MLNILNFLSKIFFFDVFSDLLLFFFEVAEPMLPSEEDPNRKEDEEVGQPGNPPPKPWYQRTWVGVTMAIFGVVGVIVGVIIIIAAQDNNNPPPPAQPGQVPPAADAGVASALEGSAFQDNNSTVDD